MAELRGYQFQRTIALPPDIDQQVNTITDRDNIPTGRRWRGMQVHVLSDNITYELRGGLDNTFWSVYGGTDVESTHYRGEYDATAGTPAITDAGNVLGDEYKVVNAGSGTLRDFGSGSILLHDGDILLHDGAVFFKKVDAYVQSLSEKDQPNGYAGLDGSGKLDPGQLPNLAITSVIVATETTIADFAANSGSYTFEEGDVIILDSGNGNGYIYNGGTKTDVNSYNHLTQTVDWSQVVNVPTSVTNPTLQTVLNNGSFGGTDNNIILQGNGYYRTDENIRFSPNNLVSSSTNYGSFGLYQQDVWYLQQTNTGVGTNYLALLDVSQLTTTNKTFTFPDSPGTFALTSDLDSYLLNTTDTFNGVLTISNNDTHLRFLENDNSNYEWRARVNAGNFVINDITAGLGNQLLIAPGSQGNSINVNSTGVGILNGNATEALDVNGNILASGSLEGNTIVKTGGTSDDILLGDGTTTSISGLPSVTSGSFSPTLIDAGGGATYSSTATGRYNKVGDLVTVSVRFLSISTSGTPTGTLRIENLPFGVDNLETVGSVLISGSDSSFYSYSCQASTLDNITILGQSASDGNNIEAVSSVTFSGGASASLRATIQYFTND